MTNSVSKALVVSAVAATCGYAGAAVITHTSLTSGTPYSLEGASGSPNASTAFVTLGTVVVSMGAFQSRDSIIQLQLTGARFGSAGVSSPSVTCSSNNLVLDIGSPTSASSTYDFGITGTSGATSTAVCSFASLAVMRSSLTSSGSVTLASGVKRTSDSAYTYDASASAATVLSVESQIASISVSTAFNGVVDFQSKQGYGFVTNDGTYGDQINLLVTTRDTTSSATSPLSVNFTISAESGKAFSFLDAESCGVAGRTPTITAAGAAATTRTTALGYAGATGGTASLTINPTCTQLTFVATKALTHTSSGHTFGVELGHQSATPSTGVVIEPMTFPAFTATVSQGSTSRATGSITPGSWTSNGATVVIPYMPINMVAGTSQIDPVVTIANRSALTGTLTGTMRDEDGNSCALDNLGTVAGTRTKNLGGLIKTAFAACTNLSQTSTERMYITITATLPDSTTSFYSGFTVGSSSRVSVINSTNGK